MRFCFYNSKKRFNTNHINNVAKTVFNETVTYNFENSIFIIQDRDIDRCFYKKDESYGHLTGYIRQYSLPVEARLIDHNSSLVSQLFTGNWPLSDDFTGTFSAIAFDNNQKRVIIANDPIGIYPIYHYQNEDKLIICSSLIMLGAIIEDGFDAVGIIQSTSGPDYCNYGKRTIIKNVSRLLPGEFIEFSLDNISIISKKYDTKFYQNTENCSLQSTAKDIVDLSQIEYEIALRYDKDVTVALSGGLDSRLMLATLPKGKNISCITYGDDDHYETKIAKRCSLIKRKTNFTNYPIDPNLQFPKIDVFSEYILQTEATGMNEWLSIFNKIDNGFQNKTLLMGDMCESIPGRNLIDKKGLKIADIFNIVLQRRHHFQHSNKEEFDKWKKSKLNKIIDSVIYNRDKNIPFVKYNDIILNKKFNITMEELISGYEKDLSELFNLIEIHRLKYIELNDELFSWYTHGRIPMGKQILQANSKYFSIAPSMSMGLLRKVSKINPSLRIFDRLMHSIFKSHKILTKFSVLPVSSVPFIPQKWPFIILLSMNWIRKKIDIILAGRIMKRKNPNLRHRLVRSINWPIIYSNYSHNTIVREWFRPNHLSDLSKQCIKIVKKRKSIDSWPLSSFDVTSIASINRQINLVTVLRKKSKDDY